MLLTAEAVLAVSIIAVKFQSGHELSPVGTQRRGLESTTTFQSSHELSHVGTFRVTPIVLYIHQFQSGHELSPVDAIALLNLTVG